MYMWDSHILDIPCLLLRPAHLLPLAIPAILLYF
jgi:hypothetical protein